jgi:hypothetical protein
MLLESQLYSYQVAVNQFFPPSIRLVCTKESSRKIDYLSLCINKKTLHFGFKPETQNPKQYHEPHLFR